MLKHITPRMTKYIPLEPTRKQAAFLICPAEEAFYGGSAGPGKSIGLLMAALQYVDANGYAALLLRRTYADLALPEALMDVATNWLSGTDAKWSSETKTWRFPKGATLTFGYLENEKDKFRYKSSAYQFIGFDELTQFTESQYLYLFSRLRRTNSLAIPLRMRSASNPDESGFDWVRRRMILDGRKNGITFIPATLNDNPYLDKESYVRSLAKLDAITRARLLHGDWTMQAAGKIIKSFWLEITQSVPVQCLWLRFWDTAGTEYDGTNDPDYTAGVLLGLESNGMIHIKDVVRARITPRKVEQLMQETARIDGFDVPIIIEEEGGGSGKAMADRYVREVLKGYDVRMFRPTGAKEHYLRPLAAQAEAGNVQILEADWNSDFLLEADTLGQTGKGFHDDQWDAAAKAYNVAVQLQDAEMDATPDSVVRDMYQDITNYKED